MGSESSTGVSIKDSTMTEVTKDFFFDGMVLPTSVYLRLKTDHYLVIGKETEKANFSSLHSYLNPNSLIFVSTVELGKLISYVTQITEKVVGQKVSCRHETQVFGWTHRKCARSI